MLACLSGYSYRAANGLGWSLNDLYRSIADDAGSGAAQLGEISNVLLNLGLTVEAARGALTTVARNVGANPQQLAVINAELNYLNTYGQQPTRNDWVLPVLVIGGLLLWTLAEDK